MQIQKERIEQVLQQDEYMIIVLDACRYDYLDDLVESRGYPLEVEKLNSGCPNTHTWVRETWDKEYDITYVSPIPYISNSPTDGPGGGPAYNGADHFENVIEAWRTDWDEDIGGLPPHVVAEKTHENLYPRMIVHFGQPHMPHIGEPSLLNREINSNNLSQVGRSGEFSDDYIKRSYRANLERVWEEGVMELAPVENPGTSDRKIVITADHGEALGENGNYGHNVRCNEVLHVPWIEI